MKKQKNGWIRATTWEAAIAQERKATRDRETWVDGVHFIPEQKVSITTDVSESITYRTFFVETSREKP